MPARPRRNGHVVASTLLLLFAACGGGGADDGSGGGPRVGSILGRLAAPAPSAAPSRLAAGGRTALTLDQVTIDLLRVDTTGGVPITTVAATATPDGSGAFAFTAVEVGTYGLRVNQPEFATVAYGVDSTEIQLVADQTVNVVLPVITTLIHGLVDPHPPTFQSGVPIFPATALDRATGEVLLVTSLGLAVVDPDLGTIDVLRSESLFDGVTRLALPPTPGLAWLLSGERIVRVDRSLFSDPAASEAIDLELPAERLAAGDKVRYRLLTLPPATSSVSFTGQYHFSPDEQTLFAATADGVAVIDLAAMAIVDTIPGRLAGYNPVSNQLFFAQQTTGRFSSVAVVDATTRFDVVPPISIEAFQGVAAWPGDPRTVVVGSQLNTSSVEIPFVRVVDGAGATAVPWTRASTWLGAAADPVAAPPSFDAAGSYFTIGEAAFRILPGGGFEQVTGGIPPGPFFQQRFTACASQRVVDTTNLYRLWYGCADTSASVALLSLDQANVPIALRPNVDATAVLVDEARGRAVFRGTDRLVLVHYADPAATARDEVTDLSAAVAPWVAPGAACSAVAPCPGDEICAAPTATSGSGRCLPNPRLPYLPLCGGFADLPCDEGFTCTYVDPTRHRMGGRCTGAPNRDYAAHGPTCPAGGCPAGMACGGGGRCAPKSCVRDADCAAIPGEICGLVQNLGRVCLAPGALPDGSHCLDSSECAHGACAPVESGWRQGTGSTLFGYRGLMTCTTPCFAQAECGAGSVCLYGGAGNGDSETSAPGWASHRIPLASYCSPSTVPPTMTGCASTCPAGELCQVAGMTPGCHLGYSPEATPPSGVGTACLSPAVPNPSLVGCAFPCDRSGDCPWTTSCHRGVCDDPSCGGATCGEAESCVREDEAWTAFSCAPVESCFAQADCSAGTCSHEGCLTACTSNAECGAGSECWRFTDGLGVHTRYCLPTRCGCSGPDAAEALCDVATGKCVLEQLCSTIPCDGSYPACPIGGPDTVPGVCACPSCDWDAADCGGSAIPACPAGYACRDVGQPISPNVGAECVPP